MLSSDFIYQYKDKPTPFSNYGLGEFVYKRTYSRLKEDEKTYEEWYETIERVVNGVYKILLRHLDKNNIKYNLEELKQEAEKLYDLLFNIKFLPGGRSLWAMGTKITDEKGLYTALNNCAFVSTQNENPTRPYEFLFDACMLGVGVGFDTKGIDTKIYKPLDETYEYIIEDTREGWVKALRELLLCYFEENHKRVIFDYSKIRPEGLPLKTFGGTSSGYKPLKLAFDSISEMLENNLLYGTNKPNIINEIKEGKITDYKPKDKLNSIMILDIMNMLCKCVVSGNVRRSATISIGENNDIDFMDAKDWEKHPERQSYCWLSNNSVIAKIGMDYSEIAKRVKRGEPGIIFLENAQKYSRMNGIADYKDKYVSGTNPCISKDMLLLTDKGYITISEHVGEIVKVWNGERWTSAEVKITGQNQELFKCKFSDGSILECTKNHKFILEDGTKKELKDLSFNDKLKKSNCILIKNGELKLDYAYDNGYKLNNIPLYNYTLESRINYLSGVIDKIGLYREKNKGKRNYNYIKLITNNYEYLYKIKLLLQTLGIICNISLNKKQENKLTINNDNTIKLKELGLNCKNFIITKKDNENLYNALKLKNYEFKEIADNVYCITTLDDSHSGVFNGILTGNCGEQTLHNFELCNLTEIFINRQDNYEDFINTLTYAYKYAKIVSLCDTQWEETNKVIEQNRRLGISLTGIVNFIQDKGLDQLRQYTTKGYEYVRNLDKEYSKFLNINESIKLTTVKPSGTVSLLAPFTCPGIHYPISRYYIRRVRVNNQQTRLINSMKSKGYLVENAPENEPNTVIINFPIDIKYDREESKVSLWEKLELSAKLNEWWSDNAVSCTVYYNIETEDKDIKYALEMYQYKLKGITFLGNDGKIYPKMPYEKITKSEYDLMIKNINDKKIEIDSNDQVEEMFCTTDTCILKSFKKEKNTKIIFMNGLAGSGKSYLAERFNKYIKSIKLTCEILSKDDFRYVNGKYIFDREYENIVEEKYFNRLYELLNNNLNYIILDNTHIGNDFVEKTLEKLKCYKSFMLCIEPFKDLNKHIEQNTHIRKEDIHRINIQYNNWKLNYPLYNLNKKIYKHNDNNNFDNNEIQDIINDVLKQF